MNTNKVANNSSSNLDSWLDSLEWTYKQYLQLTVNLNYQAKFIQDKIKDFKNKIQVIGYIKESIEY